MSDAMQPARLEDVYADLRPLLLAIAYRMIGSVGEAEDVVQEAFLRYHRTQAAGTEVLAPKAFLSAVTTRLAIDHLRSARVRRETYVGPWLPEPIATDPHEDPSAHAELADSLSLAFLLVLERLSPLERAAFLLREVFDFPYEEVAAIVERSEQSARQLVSRARRRLDAERPRFSVPRERQQQLLGSFAQACAAGDTAALVGLLAEDVEAHSDGGGKRLAARKVIFGADRVARFLVGISRPGRLDIPLAPRAIELNGGPALALVDERDGTIYSIGTLDIGPGELIRRVCIVVNPDKLARLPTQGRSS